MQSIDHKPPPMTVSEIAHVYLGMGTVFDMDHFAHAIEAARDAKWAAHLAQPEPDLTNMLAIGAKAWADVPSATAWVDDLRGDDHLPDVGKMVGISKMEINAAPELPELPELPKPDTHCFDDDTQKDCWSYSADQMHAFRAAGVKQERALWELTKSGQALGAALAAREPMKHMQIVLLWGHRSDGPTVPEIVSFARLIELHHGIGA